jgi:hypothetical protein
MQTDTPGLLIMYSCYEHCAKIVWKFITTSFPHSFPSHIFLYFAALNSVRLPFCLRFLRSLLFLWTSLPYAVMHKDVSRVCYVTSVTFLVFWLSARWGPTACFCHEPLFRAALPESERSVNTSSLCLLPRFRRGRFRMNLLLLAAKRKQESLFIYSV